MAAPRSLRWAGAAVALAAAVAVASAACKTDLDCSLNGVCGAGGVCACDKPWSGDKCQSLTFNTTKAAAKSLYNISDPRNTWNGPIVTAPDGTYHIYVPRYKVGSLGGPPDMLHGVSKTVEGPYDWDSHPIMPTQGENPAAVVFPNATTGKTVYSLWMGGKIRVADSPDGPFADLPHVSYPGGNPAPVYYKGAFYMTNQGTGQVFTTPNLGEPWTVFATVNHSGLPDPTYYHVEDPFMWVDKRGNFHIVNHAYRNDEYEHCGSSQVSAHWFSPNGKNWTWAAQPWDHTVQYDDGTSHTYTTLERPNLHFDATGQLTHINLAADLVTGDEGCASRKAHSHFGHCPCDNCKWADHAGTIVVALDV